MSHFRTPSTARPGRVSRYLPIILGLLLILSPLSIQAAPPRQSDAEAAAAPLSERDWAAIHALLPESVNVAVNPATYFKASNTRTSNNFGLMTAISGDTVVIGAPNEESATTGINGDQNNTGAFQSGAVFVFVRSGATWTQQAYLKASNTNERDYFGVSVAISGDTIVVGARGDDSAAPGINGNAFDNSMANAGSAFIFVRNGTTWTQQAYLKASNPGAGDEFGETVFINGSTVVVGSSLEDSASSNQADNSAANAGAAYVFVRAGTIWSQQAYLKASNPGAGDWFTYSGIAMSGETLVIGARGEDSGLVGNPNDNSAPDAGAAYVYVRNGAAWSQQAYLKAANAGANDWFGHSVAIDANFIVVGARGEASTSSIEGDNSALNAGAAYLFERSGAAWSQQAYIKALDPDAGDLFGHWVDVLGDTVLVGAPFESSSATGLNGNQFDNSMPQSGAAYSFLIAPNLSISDATVVEGDTGTRAMTFTATLSMASSQPITATYATSAGTATAGGDYQSAAGTLQFAPGQTVRTLAVTVNGDLLDEPDETFSVTLSAPVNAVLGSAAGLGTITDDDAPPALSISDVAALEGDTGTRAMTFTATLSMASSQPITATVDIGGGTATPNVDYTAPGSNGTLRFEPGQTTRTLAITINGDLLDEPDETFSVTLSAPVNAMAGDLFSLGTIIDDDAPAAGSTIFLPRLHHTITQLLCVINANAIPISVPAQPGQIFYSTTITIPAELPAGGRFYLSSSPTSAQPALVDDELRMLDGANVIFSYVYSTSRPVPQLVEVPRATLAAFAGQPITVQFADRYSGEIQSTPMYLIWQLP